VNESVSWRNTLCKYSSGPVPAATFRTAFRRASSFSASCVRATRFLASRQPVLPGWHNSDPRSGIAKILSSLQVLTGDWIDESATANSPKIGVFCRSASCPKASVHIGDPDNDGRYSASANSSVKNSTGTYNSQTRAAWVVFEPQGDHYRGRDFALVESWVDPDIFVAVMQRGVMNVHLSPDRTTLTGEIQFEPASVKSSDSEPPCQGCVTAAQMAVSRSENFRAGTFQVRLVRK